MPEARSETKDIVVVAARREWACAECGTNERRWLRMQDVGPLCVDCADLGHLVFLPTGDAALTRRAKKASGLWAVVVRFSTTRKRYERQGLLVEEAALEKAEAGCLADADLRARRADRDRARREEQDVELQALFADAIARMYPRCPPERATAIAKHAAERGSGRVGRSAAGRAIDEHAVTVAVVASIRHIDTAYDMLLMTGVPRDEARAEVAGDIESVLDSWRS